jgi:hypothetical protein
MVISHLTHLGRCECRQGSFLAYFAGTRPCYDCFYSNAPIEFVIGAKSESTPSSGLNLFVLAALLVTQSRLAIAFFRA